MYKSLFAFLTFMLYANFALAFNCINDYSGSNGCAKNPYAAGDCSTLGYSKNIPANCKRILKCPFDLSYQRCVVESEEEKDDPKTCPSGKIFEEECTKKNGIGLVYTHEQITDKDGKRRNCVTCQTCDSSEYQMVLKTQTSGYVCQEKTYMNYMGNNYQCCKSLCPKGTTHIDICEKNKGAFKDDKADENNCGVCSYCPSGYELWKKGTFTSADIKGKQYTYFDTYNGSSLISLCVKSCDTGCTGGKYITSGDQIDPAGGTYCLGADVTFPKAPSSTLATSTFVFKPSGCTAKLTIGSGSFASKIISYVDTIINDGPSIHELELHAGGTFNSVTFWSTYTISGGQCTKYGDNPKVKLVGNHTYYFRSSPPNTTNLPPLVSCSLENGNPETKPTLDMGNGISGYIFSGNAGIVLSLGSTCDIGKADNSCLNMKCYNPGAIPPRYGTIKANNNCE